MELIFGLLFELLFNIPGVWTLALTVLPALLLLGYIRKKDRLEPESPALVWSLVGLGALAVLPAIAGEWVLLTVLTRVVPDTDSGLFAVLHWFLVVGLTEEGCKYWMLRRRTWKHPEFNCMYDGVVYAVAVSAGFALAENLEYLIIYGGSVVFIRALISIPGHICFAVLMGTWYSGAKEYALRGRAGESGRCHLLALAVPALTHGLFDLLASSTEALGGQALFYGFVIAMFVICWRLVKRLAERDSYMA